jgi:branched-chain amino acid transport system ATP-binding protein
VADPLLRVEKLVRRFGGILATDHVSLAVAKGELHAIIGPNGAGKTTLISQLTGHLAPDSGSVSLVGRDITHLPAYRRSALGLARSFQITSLLLDFTAADNVALAAQAHEGHSFRFFADARKERGSPIAPTYRSRSSAMASSVSSSLRSRSRPSRNCCCWMSRWRASASPNPRAW